MRPLLSRSVLLPISLLLLAGLTAFVVQPGQAAQPQVLPKVTIGDRTIDEGTIARAIEQCTDHGAGSALADCLNRFIVVRWLLDRQVEEQKLAERPSFAFIRSDLLHLALVDQLRAQVAVPSAEAIDKYMAAHPRDFNKPLRIRIYRLLVSTEEEAKTLLAELKMPLDLPQFRVLCREHSVDKATHERGGDLGFVWPDGSTDVPQVSADPKIYAAALTLKEGELHPEPIAEDARFAIVWRRGSLPSELSSEEDRERVKALLSEQELERKVSTLLAELEAAHVKQRADVLLGRLRRKNTQLFVEP